MTERVSIYIGYTGVVTTMIKFLKEYYGNIDVEILIISMGAELLDIPETEMWEHLFVEIGYDPDYFAEEEIKHLYDVQTAMLCGRRTSITNIVRCNDCYMYDHDVEMCTNTGMTTDKNFYCADGKV